MRKILRIRNARLFLFGDVVSTLGDSALWLAMAIWVKELTHSSAAAGLVLFAYVAGSLFAPAGGVLADRFRRRPLLICANLLAAALVLLIALVHQRGQLWLVYLVIFGYGVIGSVIGPAQTALVPALVPEDLLAEANGAQQTLNEGMRLIVPLIGAGLFVLVGPAAVAEIDAGTFLVAVASLLALRVEEAKPGEGEAREQEAAAGEAGPEPAAGQGASPAGRGGRMSAGFRFLAREPVLRSITLALGLSMLVIGFTESAAFSVVTVGLHHSASFVGVTMTVQGIGAVGGGLTAAPLLKRMAEGMLTALALGFVVAAVLLLILPVTALVLAGMVLAGFAGPWLIVAATTAIQRRTPAALLGRVSGAFGLGLTVPQTVSIGLGAALIAVVSYRVLLLVIAVVVGLAAALLASRPQRRHRTAPPAVHGSAAGKIPAEVVTAGSPEAGPAATRAASDPGDVTPH